MSAEAGFADAQFQTPQVPTPRGGNKRKRRASQSPMTTRNAPLQPRNPYEASPHDQDVGDQHSFLQHNGADFNLPALAPAPPNNAQANDNSSIDTAARALNYSMQVPPHPTETFMAETGGEENQATYQEGTEIGGNFDLAGGEGSGDGEEGATGDGKVAPGSAEWQRQRKDNHKEVERRRRETINEGINELQKVMPPHSEKNKGAILGRAVQYISKLEAESAANIDKWAFEKLVTEQAINDLSGKLHRAWAQIEAWKRVARDAGVDVDHVDLGVPPDDDEQATHDEQHNKREDKVHDDDEDGDGTREQSEEDDGTEQRQAEAA